MKFLLLLIIVSTPISLLMAGDMPLPDPLMTRSGNVITTSEEWREELREETLELFRKHIFGRAPVARPEDLRFEVLATTPDAMSGRATHKQVDIRFSGPGGEGKIRLHLFIPNHVAGPIPGFLLISHRRADSTDPTRGIITPYWPAGEIVERGYVAAVFRTADVARDSPRSFAEFREGVYQIFAPEDTERSAESWGVLGIWAWAASRVMDYLETDPDIDARRIAVVGHSRSGKAALWCGAQDERFAMAISNGSGSMGASLSRRLVGELVADIGGKFPYWFCRGFAGYAGNEGKLPVDQHQLIALMAPRWVYVASAEEDVWADPRGEFLACLNAEPVYRLFGLKGLDVIGMPGVRQPLHDGYIGYHVDIGGHSLTSYDWQQFADFADRHWRK